MTPTSVEHGLAAVARSQGGVFTRAQAAECGLTRSAAAHRLRSGQWRVVQGRVLAASTTPTGADALRWTALLLAGGSAVLSHATAAQVWGLGVAPPPFVELSTSGQRTPSFAGARVRRTVFESGDVVEQDGVPVTSQRRTLFDCLSTLELTRAQALVERAWLRRMITAADVRAEIGRRRGVPGVEQLRDIACGLEPRSSWTMPARLAGVLRCWGVTGWRMDVDVHTPLGPRRIPLAFPHQKLALVVPPPPYPRDVKGDPLHNALALAGWTALDIPWLTLLRNHEAAVGLVRAGVAAAERRGCSGAGDDRAAGSWLDAAS